jgi:hypothetical protein
MLSEITLSIVAAMSKKRRMPDGRMVWTLLETKLRMIQAHPVLVVTRAPASECLFDYDYAHIDCFCHEFQRMRALARALRARKRLV